MNLVISFSLFFTLGCALRIETENLYSTTPTLAPIIATTTTTTAPAYTYTTTTTSSTTTPLLATTTTTPWPVTTTTTPWPATTTTVATYSTTTPLLTFTTTSTYSVGIAGDPHVTNLAGDNFDIQQRGTHQLLVFKDANSNTGLHKEKLLAVSAYIDHAGEDECSPLFVQNVTLQGKWMQEAKWNKLEVRVSHFVAPDKALEIKNGELWQSASSPLDNHGIISKASKRSLAVKVNGVNFIFSLGLNRGRRALYPGYNFLNLKIEGVGDVSRLGLVEAKGLMAHDDFTEVQRRPEKCKSFARFEAVRSGSNVNVAAQDHCDLRIS